MSIMPWHHDFDHTPITERLNAQNANGAMQPGTPGLWQVWGARAHNIRVGDFVMAKWADSGEITEHEVISLENWPMGVQVFDSNGAHIYIGGLQPIVLMRPGTHHTLA
jgi:hypothetical protein